MGWDHRHRKIMAAAACYQGNCLRILCKLETFSQEVSLLQKFDVELEICVNRLHHFLGDSFDILNGEEITWDHANGGWAEIAMSPVQHDFPAANKSTESRSAQRALQSLGSSTI